MTPTCTILMYHPRLTQILLTLQNTSCLTKKDKYFASKSFSLVSVIVDNSYTVPARIRALVFFFVFFVFKSRPPYQVEKKERLFSRKFRACTSEL